MLRNQTGVDCENVFLDWGGGHITAGVLSNEIFKVSVDAYIPKGERAELHFTESATKKLHKLPCDMSKVDRVAVSEAKSAIHVVFTLDAVKVVVGKMTLGHIPMDEEK